MADGDEKSETRTIQDNMAVPTSMVIIMRKMFSPQTTRQEIRYLRAGNDSCTLQLLTLCTPVNVSFPLPTHQNEESTTYDAGVAPNESHSEGD